ncbi:hypothetical protein D6D12_06169 [Aureobasidium pullulans]|uniref:Uncharacterized protein n=1 Tax=Aureobasidium pullulans TaxID=5580 RepID=A0AB74JQ44_AURPU|nr:hypothetical protein D6D12_06169 [Aureobasidium pullulans]
MRWRNLLYKSTRQTYTDVALLNISRYNSEAATDQLAVMECGDICGKALQVKVCRATLCTAHLQQQWLLSSSSRGILIKYDYRAWAATVPDIQGTSSSCDGPPSASATLFRLSILSSDTWRLGLLQARPKMPIHWQAMGWSSF